MFINAPTGPAKITTVTPEVTDADVYEHACRVLDKRGWTYGAWIQPDGRVCLLGAIGIAAIELDHPAAQAYRDIPLDLKVLAHHVANRIVGDGRCGGRSDLYLWNDRLAHYPEREGFLRLRRVPPVESVKAKLRQMAAEARKGK